MRPIINKIVQVHLECCCGYNEVTTESFPIKFKDFTAAGIIRKKDKKTGKSFLLMQMKDNQCSCLSRLILYPKN